MNDKDTQLERRWFLARCLGGAAAIVAGAGGCAAPAGRSTPHASLTDLARAAQQEPDEHFWSLVQRQFLLAPELAYFNTGGLGPSPACVVDALVAEMTALERVGETGHERVPAVREKLSRMLNCAADELAITRNATEGMNIIARGLSLTADDEVLLTTHEHPGGAMPWLALVRDSGIKLRLVEPGGGGDETLARIAAALTPQTRVVAVSHIACTTGLRLPAREIADLCRARDVLCVLDGAQAVGMIPVDLRAIGCDFYVSSGHKWLLGPKGTGLLYIRRDRRNVWRPTYVGAYSDREYSPDRGILGYKPEAEAVEYGTRGTAEIMALGTAADFLCTLGLERVAQRGRALATYFRAQLQSSGAFDILTPADEASSASIVTFTTKRTPMDPGRWGATLQERYGIRVRSVTEHGLTAVRVSLHICNSRAEIDRLVQALSEMSTA